MREIKKLSELRREADKSDLLHHHMEYAYTDSDTGDKYLDLQIHTRPSYGYYDPDYEDTDAWFDKWWNLFISINLTKKLITDHYAGPDYDDCEVVLDEKYRKKELIYGKRISKDWKHI